MNPAAFNVEPTTKARAAIFTKGESPDQSPPWKSDTVSCLLAGHRREPHEGDMLVASDSFVAERLVHPHQPNYRGNPTNRLSVTTITVSDSFTSRNLAQVKLFELLEDLLVALDELGSAHM